MIQVRLKETVHRIRTDNGTEFVNQHCVEYMDKVGISHETSVARSPQQNSVVERQNCTLIEAARTMLIYAKAPLFLWAEAVATACYTQNRSMICRLVPILPSSTPFVPPLRSDWDLLFQPMFDESLNPSTNVNLQAPEVIAPIPEAVAPKHAVINWFTFPTTVDQ
ncbi:putative ribonuclease H-like domain-containing protein [Tanacetum coccineum]